MAPLPQPYLAALQSLGAKRDFGEVLHGSSTPGTEHLKAPPKCSAPLHGCISLHPLLSGCSHHIQCWLCPRVLSPTEPYGCVGSPGRPCSPWWAPSLCPVNPAQLRMPRSGPGTEIPHLKGESVLAPELEDCPRGWGDGFPGAGGSGAALEGLCWVCTPPSLLSPLADV